MNALEPTDVRFVSVDKTEKTGMLLFKYITLTPHTWDDHVNAFELPDVRFVSPDTAEKKKWM